MTFQPPAQQNQMPPILPSSTGYSRPPLFQPIATNGTPHTNQSVGPTMFSQPQPVSSFAPTVNPTSQAQWTQPNIPGQGSAFSPINQPNAVPNLQPLYSGGGPPRNPPLIQNAGRPPSTPVMSPTSSGRYLLFNYDYTH